MHWRTSYWILLSGTLLSILTASAQDSSRIDKLISAPDKLFGALDKKTQALESSLDRQTGKYLNRLERQEARLKKKLWKRDSTLAKELFGPSAEFYNKLKNTSGLTTRYSSFYSGHLDSLTTSLKFLQQGNLQDLSGNASLQKSLEQYKALQTRFNASDQIRKQLLQRQKLLKEQFEKMGMVKELKQFRKEVYYYHAQVKEYKEAFEDPSKMEAKLMELVMKVPQFRDFFRKNSVLGSLFALPGASGTASASFAGLQTRAQANQNLINRFGTGPDVTSIMRQNVQAAQGQMNQLSNRLTSYASGSYGNGGDADIPEFKPNSQRTKYFFKRLELGANIQSQKARYFFPVTSDIGLSLGYKLNDKGITGIGLSYAIGWGRGWNHIQITHQGIGLRSYIDWKWKGSFYLSGGYEQNYRSQIHSVYQLKDFSAWQRSGLIGVSKRYKASKKLNGEVKLLWDFLSYQQIPRTQPILFRLGYSLK